MTVSDRVFEFAQDAFENMIRAVLDDPSELLSEHREQDPSAVIREYRALATDLSFDFDHLVRMLGTAFEVERFQKIEAGAIPPRPRK